MKLLDVDNTLLSTQQKKRLARLLCEADIGESCTICSHQILEPDLETYVTADHEGGVAHAKCWDDRCLSRLRKA